MIFLHPGLNSFPHQLVTTLCPIFLTTTSAAAWGPVLQKLILTRLPTKTQTLYSTFILTRGSGIAKKLAIEQMAVNSTHIQEWITLKSKTSSWIIGCHLYFIVSYGGPVTSSSFHNKGNGWTSALGRGTALSTTRTAQLSSTRMVLCPVPICQQATHKCPVRTHCPHVLVILFWADSTGPAIALRPHGVSR